MGNFTLEDILSLNQHFYQSVAEEFSRTREKGWSGWDNLLPYIKKLADDGKFSILDLGCGNGRFLEFILSNFHQQSFKYTGLDFSQRLLSLAKLKYIGKPQAGFQRFDVIKGADKINGKYDLVVAFGLTHHLPYDYLTEKWLPQIVSLLNNNGYLALSFWDIGEGKGEYLMGWGNNSKVQRYVCVLNQLEIKKVIEILVQLKLELVADYTDTHNKKNKNRYLVFKK
jgi:tRNA (uracil-5-)-methyltransferase TRM9